MIKSQLKHVKFDIPSRSVRNFSIILSACCMTACATASQTALSSEQVNLVDAFPVASNASEFTGIDTIQVGDKLSVEVFGHENLTSEYIVDRSGSIAFPLLGDIQVANINTFQLRETLTQRYGESYLQNPGVSIILEPRERGKIVVDGAVNEPGVHDIDESVTLSAAIAMSGGLNQDAKDKGVFVVRNVGGERLVRQVNLDHVRHAAIPDPVLLPNDLVFVEESTGRIALREFLRTVPALISTTAILATR